MVRLRDVAQDTKNRHLAFGFFLFVGGGVIQTSQTSLRRVT
jgi:hypothetical protein